MVRITIQADCPACNGQGCSHCNHPLGVSQQGFTLDETLEHHYIMGRPIRIVAKDDIRGKARFEITMEPEA